MVRIWSRAALALLTVLVVAPAGSAAPGDCRLIRGADTPDDPSDDVSVCEAQTYFHRAGPGLANLGNVPSFDGTAPTAADSAAYATILGRQLANDNRVRPTFEGKFTGDIDTLRVDEYVTSPVYQNAGIGYPLLFELHVDGQPLVVESPAAGSEQEPALEPTSEEGIYKFSFSVKNLYQVMETNGLALGPDVEHTVRISMTALYYGDGNSVHWFDSVSRPSGIYFNVSNPKGVVYDATGY